MGHYEKASSFENGQAPTRRWIPGELTAECLIGGSVRATHTLQMAGVQTQLALSIEESGRPLVADASDFIVVQASIRDERGMISPLAENLVQFEVSGEGEIIGDESIGANPMRAEAGVASVLIRSTHRAGKIEVRGECAHSGSVRRLYNSNPCRLHWPPFHSEALNRRS